MRAERLARPLALVLLASSLGCGGSPSLDPRTPFGPQTLATGLQIPQGLAFAPDGRLFMSERPGRVRVYQNGTLLGEPALTLTDAYTKDEHGILDLTVHPDFSTNHFIYLTYTVNGARGLVGRVMRFREVDNRLVEGVVMLDDVPASIVREKSL